MYSAKFGDCMADLCAEAYYVTEVRWRATAESPLEIVGFGTEEEEQNEAYETLQELLSMEGRDDEAEEMTSAGPRRIEVELKQSHTPSVARTVVVTQLVRPKGHFRDYTLAGRIYKSCGSLENFKSTGMNSNLWKITQIKEYPGGFSAPTTTHYAQFSLDRMDVPWEKVANFMESLKPAELKVIEKWSCVGSGSDDDDDEMDMYGYGVHHTQRVPYHYQGSSYTPPPPPVAMFRTRGDEVGALLHKETVELEAERPAEEREMCILEYLEKKDEAEEEEKPEAEISASIKASDSKPSGDAGLRVIGHGGINAFCDCGSGSCPTCEESVLRPYFERGKVTIH